MFRQNAFKPIRTDQIGLIAGTGEQERRLLEYFPHPGDPGDGIVLRSSTGGRRGDQTRLRIVRVHGAAREYENPGHEAAALVAGCHEDFDAGGPVAQQQHSRRRARNSGRIWDISHCLT